MMSTVDMFAAETSRLFAFLQTNYGFSAPEETTNRYMRSMTYRTDQCEVEVNYEIGSLPWVVLRRLSNSVARLGVNLQVVVEEAGERQIRESWVAADVPDEVLTEVLQFHASALRRLADPFLRGEFSKWPELVQKQRDIHKRRVALFSDRTNGKVN